MITVVHVIRQWFNAVLDQCTGLYNDLNLVNELNLGFQGYNSSWFLPGFITLVTYVARYVQNNIWFRFSGVLIQNQFLVQNDSKLVKIIINRLCLLLQYIVAKPLTLVHWNQYWEVIRYIYFSTIKYKFEVLKYFDFLQLNYYCSYYFHSYIIQREFLNSLQLKILVTLQI